MAEKNILIAGAGQLGSRYLQGLAMFNDFLNIYVYDISEISLSIAKKRWVECAGYQYNHNVIFLNNITDVPLNFDLVIVSTTANSRPRIIKDILCRSKVNFWILEKVLAQSINSLSEIHSSFADKSSVWINTPRRAILWHQLLRKKLRNNLPLNMSLTGGAWGLACNAIHFLDYMSWLSGEALVSLNTDCLENVWHEAKRPGNWEIFGTLTASYSGGSSVSMTSSNSMVSTYTYDLKDADGIWHVNEEHGTATHSNGFQLNGKLPYQSEMTAPLIRKIFETHQCDLTSLDESIAIHKIFIQGMQDHWCKFMDSQAQFVPIT